MKLCFQLQLDGCKHEVMIVAYVDAWARSCAYFIDAGLEALGCQDEVYLAVSMPIRGVPRCCCRQLVGIECVSKDKSVVLRNL